MTSALAAGLMSVPHNSSRVSSETISPAYLLTGATHPAFPTNHINDTNNTKYKNLQPRANETNAWIMGPIHYLARTHTEPNIKLSVLRTGTLRRTTIMRIITTITRLSFGLTGPVA